MFEMKQLGVSKSATTNNIQMHLVVSNMNISSTRMQPFYKSIVYLCAKLF
jgi:hypothetical protein